MLDIKLREHMDMPDGGFPIKLLKNMGGGEGTVVSSHWHEHMELWLVKKGEASVQCNKDSFYAVKDTLVLINCNDIHSAESRCSDFLFDCIIIDISLLKSGFMDNAQVKFITPIIKNSIIFENQIADDKFVVKCLKNVIKEYKQKQLGYELAIKAGLFEFFTLLVRNYVSKMLTPQECDMRMRTLQRFKAVFEYMEKNFSERISIEDISAVANLSPYYFCRLFKDTTGRSFIDYLNGLRIDKAEQILKETDMNITETALLCGFDDINYFSKMFKRYKGAPPSRLRKRDDRQDSN